MVKNSGIIILLGLFLIIVGAIAAVLSGLSWWPAFLAAIGISVALMGDYRTFQYGLFVFSIGQILFLIAVFLETHMVNTINQLLS